MQKLTITQQRQKVVNFTSAFINTAFTAVMRREPVFHFFTLKEPFDNSLWLAIIASVVVTSVSLYALMRLQRRLLNGNRRRHQKEEGKKGGEAEEEEMEEEEDEELFFSTLEETYWFCLKSLLNQG